MELEEMKTLWEALDKKLSESNRINAIIVHQMTEQRTKKGINNLITFELIGTILCIIGLPFMVFMFKYVWHTPLVHATMYLTIATFGAVCISQSLKLFLLSKIDFTQSISNIILHLNRYTLFLKREKIPYFIVASIIAILFISTLLSFKHVEPWRWAGVICGIVLAVVGTVWQYKKIYGSNIEAIRRSLDELRELKND